MCMPIKCPLHNALIGHVLWFFICNIPFYWRHCRWKRIVSWYSYNVKRIYPTTVKSVICRYLTITHKIVVKCDLHNSPYGQKAIPLPADRVEGEWWGEPPFHFFSFICHATHCAYFLLLSNYYVSQRVRLLMTHTNEVEIQHISKHTLGISSRLLFWFGLESIVLGICNAFT